MRTLDDHISVGSRQVAAPVFFKSLAVGVGLRLSHYHDFCSDPNLDVDFLEIITENFFHPRAQQTLEQLVGHYPIHMHGVSLAIGNTNEISPSYLKRLEQLIKLANPVVVSDHLCWTGFHGVNVHDLLPLPYTFETLDHVVARLNYVQEFLGRSIAIENPSSYVEYEGAELSESEFLAQMVKRSGCQLLLDINNVYVSSQNHSFDPIRYLQDIPREAIAQFHIAGHTDHGTHILDTHIGPVPDPVIELMRHALQMFPARPLLLEWDQDIPPLPELLSEGRRIRHLLTGEHRDIPILIK